MSATNTNTVIDWSTDAAFRTAGSEINNMLTTVGLTQTADTGQINWTTATRTANTDSGYEIWRFNDTLQATYPIYIRINYGCASTTSQPRIRVVVGTASNGAGTVSGLGSASTLGIVQSANATPKSTTTSYPSYVCYSATAGFLGLVWKCGGLNGGSTYSPLATLMISRTTDNTGTPTGEGVQIMYMNETSGGYLYAYMISNPYNSVLYSANLNYGLVHYSMTSSVYSSTAQLFNHYTATPKVLPSYHHATVCTSEIPPLSTLTAATLYPGSGAHNYVCISDRSYIPGTTTNNHGIIMLYE